MAQGRIRGSSPQLTPAQDYERKRKFRVPRFVSDYQGVVLVPIVVAFLIVVTDLVVAILIVVVIDVGM
jgi:hypothetical protein